MLLVSETFSVSPTKADILIDFLHVIGTAGSS